MSQWQHLYNSAGWRRERGAYLRLHPLCVRCGETGRVTVATVVDHIVPHRGDLGRFWDAGNWQSMCKHCHDGHKQRLEARGYAPDVDPLTGWPRDSAHPANSGVVKAPDVKR